MKDKDLIESYSYGGFAYSPSLKYKIMVRKNNPIGAMVIRKKFDMGLVQLAVDNGTDFIDGRAVEDIKISNEKVKIILSDKTELNSEIVIGADGVRSIVAKKSGLEQTPKQIGLCILQEYSTDEKTIDKFFDKEKMCHMHLGFHNVSGYGWIFPKKQHLNIGIVELFLDSNTSKPKMNLLNIFNDYIKILKKTGMIPKNLEIGRCKGGTVPVAPLEKTYADRVIVVGDAGGFINPLSGEGIYYAMSSGKIAAQVITESLETGDTSEKFLSNYQKNWKKDFGKDIEILLRLTKNIRVDTEKFVKLASRDKKLADISLDILHGNVSISEYSWKLITRYLYANFKELFSKIK